MSVGNAARNDRVALILMDYAHRLRLKVLGHMRAYDIADAPPELVFDVELPDYRARVERVVTIAIEAFDWNCPQHIKPRFTEAEIEEAVQPLRARIAELEAEVKTLRGAALERPLNP